MKIAYLMQWKGRVSTRELERKIEWSKMPKQENNFHSSILNWYQKMDKNR